MKRIVVPFLLSLTLLGALFAASRSVALAPPPRGVQEVSVSHDCIHVGATFMAGQEPGYGTGGKGPAVQIANNCSFDMVFSLELAGEDGDEAARNVDGITTKGNALYSRTGYRIKTEEPDPNKLGQRRKSEVSLVFVFDPAGKECVEAGPHTEQSSWRTPKADRLKCKTILLEKKGGFNILTAGIAYGTCFRFTGDTDEAIEAAFRDIEVKGCVIKSYRR